VLAIALRCGTRPVRFPLSLDRAKKPLATTGRQKILSCALIGYGVLALSLLYLGASTRRIARVPLQVNLEQLMPPPPVGWQAKAATGLGALEPILATQALACRSYWIEHPGKPTEITLYLAFWQPGQAPVSLVAAHTPDACWPGIGWVAQPESHVEDSWRVAGRSVPEAHSRVFANDGNLLHVWFWHFVGGRPLEYENPSAVFRLFRLALKYGFQPEREQLFVRISSNRSWAEISDEPLVAQFIENLRPYGF